MEEPFASRNGSTLHATLDAEAAATAPWDAIVLGAGPAGAISALLLARAGLRTLLVERKTLPKHKPCGGCLNARAVAFLGQIGLEEPLVEAGAVRLAVLELYHRGAKARLPLPGGLAVSRWTLDATLARAALAAGAAFLPDTAATVLAAEPDAPTRAVHLQSSSGGETRIAGSLIIAADGLAHGSLRQCAEFADEIAPASRVGVGAVLEGESGLGGRGTIGMAIGRHGYAGVVGVEAGRTNVAAALDPEFLRARGGAAECVLALFEEAGLFARGVPEAVAARCREAAWLGTVPLTRRTPRPVGRRVFVLGDAASYVEPFTGEGMALAFAATAAMVPFALRGRAHWDAGLEHEWLAAHHELVARDQRRSRYLARLVRQETATSIALRIVAAWPRVASPFLAHLAASDSAVSFS